MTAREANAVAASYYRSAATKLNEAQTAARGPAPPDVWAHYENALVTLNSTVAAAVADGAVSIETDVGVLHVANTLNHDLRIAYTQDADYVDLTWHNGDSDGDTWVYYEIYSTLGQRLSHGWVDKVSRKLVQTG